MWRKQWLFLVVILIGLSVFRLDPRVSAQQAAAPQAVTVTMKDFEFQPKNLTIPAGSTVTWVNNGTKKHSATADDKSFDTGLLNPGQSKSVKFDKPGTFAYYCQLHGGPNGDGMSAVIVVTGATGADQGQQGTATVEPTNSPATALTAAPASAVTGNVAVFSDKTNHADTVTVSIKGFTPLASGHVFQAWLADAQGKPFSLGQMAVAADGSAGVTFVDAKGTNLVGKFSQALVTDQPGGNLTNPGPVIYSGAIPPQALVHVRHVLFAFPDTPKNAGLLPGAFANMKVLAAHVVLAQKSVAANDLTAARLHLEHIYNIAMGTSAGKDLNENGKIDVPPDADGFGVIPYLQRASDHAKLAADAADASDRIKLHSVNVQAGAKSAIDRLTQITVLAQQGEDAGNLAGIKPVVDQIAKLATDTVTANGSMNSAYAEALAMAAIDLSTGSTAAPSAAATAVATEAAANGDGASAPTSAPAQAQSQTITMVDFQFNPKQITVPVGTTVTWVNNGTKNHSATADDGSFDTGLFPPGQSKSVTFNKPGTFPYYCQLHGDKGGVAMSGVVIVQ